MVLIQKIGIGLSVQLLGFLLSIAGYQSTNQCLEGIVCQGQPTSAQITIRLCMGLIPAILVAIGLVLMRRWPNSNPQVQPAKS